MTKETADRLIEYRKKAGYSQEELADEIGVSRQAVSKWERCESSPDTDNLIALARLYHVSLDDLVNGSSIDAAPVLNEGKKGSDFSWNDDGYSVEIKEGEISVKDEDGEVKKYDLEALKKKRRKEKMITTTVSSVCALLVTVAYLVLGFCLGGRGWACGWTLFLLIPLVSSFVEFSFYKRVAIICYPALVVGIYCTLGMVFGIWHPTWVMFITIPAFYIIAGKIDRATRARDYEAIEDAFGEKNDQKK